MDRKSNLRIEIGGIAVGIHSEQVDLLKEYHHYYDPFTSMITPAIEIEFHVSGNEETWNQELVLQNGIILLNTRAVGGEIDCDRKKNYVTLNTNSLFETIDYLLRATFALLAFREGGLIIHAAGLKKREFGYLFMGHSGAGKSTVARFSGDALVLNDDLVMILPSELGWIVHGTPFWNPTQARPNPCSALLMGIYALVQDTGVYIEQISHGIALAELITNVPVLTQSADLSMQVMDRCDEIIQQVQPVRLHFLPDDSFWHLIEKDLMTKLFDRN